MPTPVAWWRLNEQSGTEAADSLGSAAGAYIGTPTLGETDSPSTNPDVLSVALDGVDDKVDLLSSANTSGLDVDTAQGTIMAWFRPPPDNTNPAHDTSDDQKGVIFLLGSDEAVVPGVQIAILTYEYKDENPFTTPAVKQIGMSIYSSSTTEDVVHDLDLADTENNWYHIAMTWGSGAATLYVYGPIDGEPTTQVLAAQQAHTWTSAPASFCVAGEWYNLYARGHLCDLKLYETPLTQVDIEAERDRRDYSAPIVVQNSGEAVEGLARAVQGAVGSFQQVTWSKGGAALDLTGATLTGVIKPRFGSARPVSGTLAIDQDPTTGRFVWVYDGTDVQSAGLARVQFTATYEGTGRVEKTLPANWLVLRGY